MRGHHNVLDLKRSSPSACSFLRRGLHVLLLTLYCQQCLLRHLQHRRPLKGVQSPLLGSCGHPFPWAVVVPVDMLALPRLR